VDVRGLAQLDLNLLVHLHVLLEEQHVTRAAERLQASQPAVSRALGRLRTVFGDPLLVRSGRGLTLTERARALAPRVADLLRATHELTRGNPFDPAQARGTIRLAAPDIVALMLVPPLVEQLASRAPGLGLEVVHWQTNWRHHLEEGEVDLTVGFPSGDEPRIYARPLFEQEWAVVLRRGHPALKRKWSAATYAELSHVLVTVAGRGGSLVDDALSARGLTRRIALRVPYPLAAPLLARDSDVAVTTVRWLALKLAGDHGLVIRQPPVAVPPVRVPMVWHERSHREPQQRWFREQVVEAAASIKTSLLRW